MKVGGNLNYLEDYLFWRLAHYFITEQKYRLVQLSKDQKELWLEKRENKTAQLIRLLRFDIDWSNWMQQDIERIAAKGEGLRKQITRGELHVFNVYVSAYPPVDDYALRIDQPYKHPVSNKTIVKTSIIERTTFQQRTQQIGNEFGSSFGDLPSQTDDFSELVDQLKKETMSLAVAEVEKERSLFEYGKPFFTYFFIVIQVIMFIILEAFGGSTDTSTLIKFGAKFNPLILEGEWWRLFTPIFLHIGFFHLLMNTFALYYLGTAVERIFGRARFLFIYIIAGLGGSIASFFFSPNLSAGASGAIFGCFGALLYFGVIYPKLFLRTMGANIFIVLVINLSFGFTVPGIDNAGHIGGLIGGFLATGVVHFPKKRKIWLQMTFTVVAILLASGLLRFGFANPSFVLDESSVLMMSQEYIQNEEYEKAYELLIQTQQEKELSSQYYFLLSYSEIKLNKIKDAKNTLLKAVELDPSLHEAHYNLALVYMDLQESDQAYEHAKKAAEIAPNNQAYNDLLKQFGGS